MPNETANAAFEAAKDKAHAQADYVGYEGSCFDDGFCKGWFASIAHHRQHTKELVEKIEWPEDLYGFRTCPSCRKFKRGGHTTECALAAALRNAGIEP